MPELSAGPIQLAVAFLTGAGIGAVYLGLLWVATRALARPRGTVTFVLLAFARALLVIAFIAAAFVLAIPTLAIAMAGLGFIAARVLATRAASQGTGDAQWK